MSKTNQKGNTTAKIALARKIVRLYYEDDPNLEYIQSYNNIVFRLKFSFGNKILKIARSKKESNIGKELYIINKAAKHNIPVPQIDQEDSRGKQIGLPYMIMKSAGEQTMRLFEKEVSGISKKLFYEMGNIFAKIHEVSFKRSGYISGIWIKPFTKNPFINYLKIQKKSWENNINYVVRHQLITDKEGKWALEQLNNLPSHQGSSLCHGDFNCYQCIVQGMKIKAVVDWESAKAFDPVYDYTDRYIFFKLCCHPLLGEYFKQGYLSRQNLPKNYEQDYLSVQIVSLLSLLSCFHRTQQKYQIKQGIELFKQISRLN